MSSFIRGTFKVIQGTVIAQAIGVIALFVLSRLFEPSAFGHFQLFTACLTVSLVAAHLRYEIAVLQCADGDELDAVLRLSFLINGAVVMLAVLVCGAVLSGVGPRIENADVILWLLPLGLVAGGALQLLGYLPLRFQDYALSARAKIVQAIGFASAGILLGAVHYLPDSGLIVADIAGRVVTVMFLAGWAVTKGLRLFRPVTRESLNQAARKHRELAFVAVPGGMVNAAGGLLTSMLIYAVFDPATSGQYALMERSCFAPIGIIAVAVAQVYTGELARKIRDRELDVLFDYRRLVRLMFLMGLGPAVLIALSAPFLFELVFGPKWRLAGEFAQLCAPLMLASFVTVPVNMTIMIAGRQRLQLAWEIARLLVMGLAWWFIASNDASAKSAVVVSVTIAVVMSGGFLWLADRVIRQHLSGLSATA